MQPDVFIQVGARTECGWAVWTGVGLLATVCTGVLGESGGHAKALAANPAAEWPQAAVDALVVLQMGQLAETLATCGALKGPLISMSPHVNIESGIVGKFLVANLTAKAGSVFGLGQSSLEMGQHMLLQEAVRSKTATTRPHWAFERSLARMGQPVEVEALLGHATVAT